MRSPKVQWVFFSTGALLGALAFSTLAFHPEAHAQSQPIRPFGEAAPRWDEFPKVVTGSEMTAAELYDRARHGVARVTTRQIFSENGEQITTSYIGTAFFIAEQGNDGYLLTNCHVVSPDKADAQVEATVRFEETNAEQPFSSDGIPVDVRGCDQRSDLAVLHMKQADYSYNVGNYRFPPVLPFADPSSLRVGQDVVTIGFALGIEGSPSINRGIISGLDRTLAPGGSIGYSGLIQTDAAINHGNSGGPMLNMRGEVVGVNTYTNETLIKKGTDLDQLKAGDIALATPYGVFYARSVATAAPFARMLIDDGKIARNLLGLNDGLTLSDTEAYDSLGLVSGGILIKELAKGSVLERAGLQVFDIIDGIRCRNGDGKEVSCSPGVPSGFFARALAISSFVNLAAFFKAGQSIDVSFSRPQLCAMQAAAASKTPDADCIHRIHVGGVDAHHVVHINL